MLISPEKSSPYRTVQGKYYIWSPNVFFFFFFFLPAHNCIFSPTFNSLLPWKFRPSRSRVSEGEANCCDGFHAARFTAKLLPKTQWLSLVFLFPYYQSEVNRRSKMNAMPPRIKTPLWYKKKWKKKRENIWKKQRQKGVNSRLPESLMQTPYCCSGHINMALTASDQALMVFIVAMGPFTEILLRSFLFMIFPKLSLEETADYGRLLTRGLWINMKNNQCSI